MRLLVTIRHASGGSISGDAYYVTRPSGRHDTGAISDEVWGIFNAAATDGRLTDTDIDYLIDHLMSAAEEYLTQRPPEVLV